MIGLSDEEYRFIMASRHGDIEPWEYPTMDRLLARGIVEIRDTYANAAGETVGRCGLTRIGFVVTNIERVIRSGPPVAL